MGEIQKETKMSCEADRQPLKKAAARTKTRWAMLSLIMVVMCVNYLDRGNLAVSAPVMQKELGINSAQMGLLFSAFAWSYAFIIPFGRGFVG